MNLASTPALHRPLTVPLSSVRSPPSFERLYQDQADFTSRVLRHLGVRPQQVEDAAQEVWVAVHRRLADFEGRSSAKTWLFGISANVARNYRRGYRRHPPAAPLPEQLPGPGLSPDAQSERRQAAHLVQLYLDTLDETRRTLFIAHLLEGLPVAEAAAAAGVPPGVAANRIRALWRGFQRWLKRRAETEQGGAPHTALGGLALLPGWSVEELVREAALSPAFGPELASGSPAGLEGAAAAPAAAEAIVSKAMAGAAAESPALASALGWSASGVKWFAIASVSAAAGGALVGHVQRGAGSEPSGALARPPLARPAVATATPAAPAAPALAAPVQSPQPSATAATPVAAPTALPRAAPPRAKRSHSAQSPRSAAAPLGPTLVALEQAQRALHVGQPKRALAWLDALGPIEAGQPLLLERLTTQALALCGLGRQRDAQKAMQRLATLPQASVYAARLALGCAQNPSPSGAADPAKRKK